VHVLVTADTVGGVWTYTRELACGLLNRGHRVTLVDMEGPAHSRASSGGESRMTHQDHDLSAYVEATVQSGVVTTAQPDPVRYFRCNMASDHEVGTDLAAYFTDLYGAPASKTDAATVWLGGAAKGAAPDSDDAALKAVEAAGADAQGLRIELTRERGLDRAKLTLFEKSPQS